MIWKNKLIKKAIKRYKYAEKIDDCTSSFLSEYDFFSRKENLKKYPFAIWATLGGSPDCTHIIAKNLLFQEDTECWKYFERTALFWTMSNINDPWIDHMKAIFEYSLYVERKDIIQMLFKKTEDYFNEEEYTKNKEYINQKVYPSAQLVQFLIDKWLGYNPVKTKIAGYGSGYGIYQNLIDNWADFSKIESFYWNELCEYHLKGLSLEKEDDYKSEEFLGSGLIPMELINIVKVRKKLGLDIPTIDHELFKTTMARDPEIPTGYVDELDVKYQLVKRTIETKQKWGYDEIKSQLQNEFGAAEKLFL